MELSADQISRGVGDDLFDDIVVADQVAGQRRVAEALHGPFKRYQEIRERCSHIADQRQRNAAELEAITKLESRGQTVVAPVLWFCGTPLFAGQTVALLVLLLVLMPLTVAFIVAGHMVYATLLALLTFGALALAFSRRQDLPLIEYLRARRRIARQRLS